MIGCLPETLEVCGVDRPIRSDYRNVLQVFEMFDDPDFDQRDKWEMAIYLIFADFSCADDVEIAILEGFDVDEAAERLVWFISAGDTNNKEKQLPVYSWAKDEQMIFSAVNKICGKEAREVEYMHWWTFLGYFNEVGEGTFSFIVGIRDKLNKGKKLEKHEWEFYRKNHDLVDMNPPLSKEEQQAEDEYNALLDEVLG